MNVYYKNKNKKCNEYIGKWYPSQSRSQSIFLQVDVEKESFYVDYDPEIGGAIPIEVFTGKSLRFCISQNVLTKGEAEKFCEFFAEKINALIETSRWDSERNYARCCSETHNELIDEIDEYFDNFSSAVEWRADV